MARERVQVQGLGDVAPGIQPTIQRAGQYGIQVQRAGRNKLQDLAGALSQVNPTLQQYIGVAEQEAQIFEEDLARKSPEEVQAMLKQTEGELDKQVRRGAMGWLTSPLNQKRKMQAVGALLHDDYERQLKAQVEDPANSDADINELIAGVKDNLRNQYGSLQSTFVNEGFEGSIRETTRRYTLAHDSLATAQARSELNRAGKSVLFNASTLVNGEIADPEAITNWWAENEGAFTPSELKKLRDDVVLLHASRGNFEAAREFQEYTSNLKAGTTKMGDPDIKDDDVFGMYSAEEAALRQNIDDMEVSSDARLVADSKKQLREYDELAVDIGLAIRTEEGYTAEDGTVIKNKEDAEAYLLKELQTSNNIMVRGSDGVALVQNALKRLEMPSDENYILFKEKYARAYTGPQAFRSRYQQIIQSFEQSVGEVDFNSGKTIVNPRYTNLANNLLVDMARKRDEKILEMSTGTFTDVNGELITTSKFQEQMKHMKAWDDFYLREYNEKLTTSSQDLKPLIETEKTYKTQIEEESTDPESFVAPGNKLSDYYDMYGFSRSISKGLTFDADFIDLEKAMRDGDDPTDIVKELETTSEQGLIPPFTYKNKIQNTLNTIQSSQSTPEQVQAAKNKIALYSLAKGLYTPESIKKGSITISFGGVPSKTIKTTAKKAEQASYEIISRTGFADLGAIARVPGVQSVSKEIKIDKAAVKNLASVFPLISKERLTEIAGTAPEEFPQEQSLFEALYDVELDPDNPQDQKLLGDFIRKQAAISQRIYKD